MKKSVIFPIVKISKLKVGVRLPPTFVVSGGISPHFGLSPHKVGGSEHPCSSIYCLQINSIYISINILFVTLNGSMTNTNIGIVLR